MHVSGLIVPLVHVHELIKAWAAFWMELAFQELFSPLDWELVIISH